MCTYAGRQMEDNMYEQVEDESVKKLPWDMLIPNSSYATANKHATKSSHCKLRNLTK